MASTDLEAVVTPSERNANIGVITVLGVNAILALSLLITIGMKAQHFSLLFFFNVTMLLLTIIHSSIMITFHRGSILGIVNLPLYITGLSLNVIIKIVIELILIIRLRTLYPGHYFLLAWCGIVVVLRTLLDISCKWLFVLYGVQAIDGWMFTVEPFMTAGNITFFSSVFILTLISKMYIRHTVKALRRHRLFPFLVLSIENMIVPCITSITLAVYSLYVHGNLMVTYRALLLFVHMGVTVVSIILTTVLGNSSRIRHHSLDQLDETTVGRKDRQVRTLSMAPEVKVLMEAKHGEHNNEFEFVYLGTEGGSSS